jgi:hypothetical protein
VHPRLAQTAGISNKMRAKGQADGFKNYNGRLHYIQKAQGVVKALHMASRRIQQEAPPPPASKKKGREKMLEKNKK